MSRSTPLRGNSGGNPPFTFDHRSFDSAADSTVSSVSGSTATSWSIPRIRAIGLSRKVADGPRRSGSSFRVSLKPNRYRQTARREGCDDSEDDDIGSSCNVKNIFWIFVAALVMGTVVRFIEPNASRMGPFYDVHDKVSTEDLIAQGEMSSRAVSDDDVRLHQKTPINIDETKQDEHTDETQVVPVDVSLRGSLPPLPLQKSFSNQEFPTQRAAPILMNATEKTYRTIATAISSTGERTGWGPSFQPREIGKSTVVAYVLPVYTCYKLASQAFNPYNLNDPANDGEFHDAVLMLQASIHQSSVRNPNSQSSYDYEMVALVHKGVEQCEGGANRTLMLLNLGYRVEVVREPINQVDIKNKYLKIHAPRNNGGRAGMKEMIRLYVFKLVEYEIAVLVDTTTWVLRPLDATFDMMLNGPSNHSWLEKHEDHIVRENFYPNGTIYRQDTLPSEIDIMYTRDYSAMTQGSWNTGISLNFLPVRPNLQIFHKLINTFQNTEYDAKWGWEHKGYAKFTGSMMTKGLLTYFYNEKMPDQKLELHRCIYNNMADVPYIAGNKGEKDNCRDVKEHREGPDGKPVPCTDCRIKEWDKIIVVNFQTCQVPWVCPFVDELENVPLLIPTLKMCRRFHQSWFALRASVEASFLTPEEQTTTAGTFHPDIFSGYCIPGGPRGGAYVAMGLNIHFPNGISNNRSPTTQ